MRDRLATGHRALPSEEDPPLLVLGVSGDSQRMRTVEAGLRLLGGRAVISGGSPTLERVLESHPRGVIATPAAVAALGNEALQAIRASSGPYRPWLLIPNASAGAQYTAALDRLTEEATALTDATHIEHVTLTQDPLLGSLRGLRLRERARRTLPLAAARGGSPIGLIDTPRGALFARYDRPLGAVFAALAPIVGLNPGERLRDHFRSDDFLGVLPLLLFIKHALGEAAWRTHQPSATFLVDDPNLRSMRYGCLDYKRLVEAAQIDGFHTTIAMVPIDYRKTRASVAAFFRGHERYLSLVIHGVDHARCELGRRVSVPVAEAKLREGIRRMEAHRRCTGLAYARVMTFPHGECNEVWMAALSRTGFAAAVADSARPWNPGGAQDDPLYEMLPAELGYRGFPVINRYEAGNDHRRFDLLFDAWLGKPLILYAHHDFFVHENTRVIDLARFISEHVAPTWHGVRAITEANYQTRRVGSTVSVRVFSHDLASSARPDHERCIVRGPSRGQQIHAEPARLPLRGLARRALTEARDRGAGLRQLASRRLT